MDMIGHQAEAVNSATKSLDSILETEIKTIAVSIAEKNGLISITTENHMINRSGKMKSRFMYHEKILFEEYLKVKPDPA
jgi:hypothetical protein